MKNIKHINFLSEKSNKRAIIYFDDKQIEVSRKAGEFALRQYAKDHNIDDYLKLKEMNFVNSYAVSNTNKSSRELPVELILMELKRRNDLKPILSSDISSIDFFENEDKDICTKIKYKYTFQDGDKIRNEELTEDVDVKEAIDLLVNHANENGVKYINELFGNDGIVNVQNDLNEYFDTEIIPKLQTRLERKRAGKQDTTTTKEENVDTNGAAESENSTTASQSDQNNTFSNTENSNSKQMFGMFKKDIGKIVKYSFIDENDEIRTCAVIFYNDGSVRNVSEEEADELFAKFAYEHGISEVSLRSRDLNFFDFVSGKTLIEEFDKYYKEAIGVNDNLNDYIYNDGHKNVNNNSKAHNNANGTQANGSANNTKNSKNANGTQANGSTNNTKNSKNGNGTQTNSSTNNTKDSKNAKRKKRKHHCKAYYFFKNLFDKLMVTKPMKIIMGNRIVKRIAIGIGALLVLGGGVKLVKDFSFNDKDIEPTTTGYVDDKNYNDNVTDNNMREDFSNCTYQELLQKCKNNTNRKDAMKTIREFVTEYNYEAYRYKEEKSDVRAVHTLDEAMAMYLAYNDIDSEKVNEIFKGTNMTFDGLRNSLISAQYQDALVHNIQDRTFNKADLFTKQADKDLYNKYENLFMSMNCAYDKDKKEFKEKFNDMVRADLSGIATGDYSNVDCSKVIIKEFMDAMDNVNIKADNELTAQEKNYINGIMANVVDKKLNTIVIRQNARNLEMTMGVNSQVMDQEPYYNDFKDAIIKELTDNNCYYTTDENRDVSYYNVFARNTLTDTSENKKNTNTSQNVANNASTSKDNSSANNNGGYSSSSTGTTNTNNSQTKQATSASTSSSTTQKENNNSNVNNSSSTTNTSNDSVTPNTPNNNDGVNKQDYVDEAILKDEMVGRVEAVRLTDEIDNSSFDFDRHPYPPVDAPVIDDDAPTFDVNDFIHMEDENTGVDEITPDDIPTEDITDNIDDLIPGGIEDFEVVDDTNKPEEDSVSIDENVVNIDQDKVDENGNLSDQYTDVTTDENGQNSQMSNDEIADAIIRQMEQEASDYIRENDIADFGKTL